MKQPYNTALYYGLSRDDENFGDSVSIETQRTILQQFARDNQFHVVGEYIDVYNQRLIPFDTKTAVQTLKITAFEGKVPVESRDFYF